MFSWLARVISVFYHDASMKLFFFYNLFVSFFLLQVLMQQFVYALYRIFFFFRCEVFSQLLEGTSFCARANQTFSSLKKKCEIIIVWCIYYIQLPFYLFDTHYIPKEWHFVCLAAQNRKQQDDPEIQVFMWITQITMVYIDIVYL